MQSYAPMMEACIPWSQNESRTPCEVLAPRPVVAIEEQARILEELGVVRDDAGANLVKNRDWEASGIVLTESTWVIVAETFGS
jgi:hypothetical protein